MTWGERLYRALLLFYPAEFRCEYAAEMTQAFRDRQRDDHASLLWFDLIADTLWTASK